MTYYAFIQNNKMNGFGECETVNDDILNIEISKEIYDELCQEPLLYTYNNGKIIKNPNFENEKQKQIIEKEILHIKEELEDLDKKRVRAICEDEIKNEKTGETWLDFYNEQVYDLRLKYKNLKSKI